MMIHLWLSLKLFCDEELSFTFWCGILPSWLLFCASHVIAFILYVFVEFLWSVSIWPVIFKNMGGKIPLMPVLPFRSYSQSCGWMAVLVCLSVHHIGPDWNISTSGWIAVKVCTDSHGPPRMNPTVFGDVLTFLLVATVRLMCGLD